MAEKQKLDETKQSGWVSQPCQLDITNSVVSLNLVTVPGWEGARPDPMIKHFTKCVSDRITAKIVNYIIIPKKIQNDSHQIINYICRQTDRQKI